MFTVTLTARIAIEESVFPAVLTDEWRKHFYPFHTPEDVAQHLALNLVQGRLMRELDGFADQPEDDVVVGDIESIDATELRKGARHS